MLPRNSILRISAPKSRYFGQSSPAFSLRALTNVPAGVVQPPPFASCIKQSHSRTLSRHFTAAASAKTDSSAEAEVAKELWPKSKKYAPIWVPLVASIIWAVIVINDKDAKEFSEDIAPSFVNFIRNYYGFAEEDLQEANRIKETLETQRREYDVYVKLGGSWREEKLITIAGNTGYGELIQKVYQHLRSRDMLENVDDIQVEVADSSANSLSSSSSTDSNSIQELDRSSDNAPVFEVEPSLWGHSKLLVGGNRPFDVKNIRGVRDHFLSRYSDEFGFQLKGRQKFLEAKELLRRIDNNKQRSSANNAQQYAKEKIAGLDGRIKRLEQEKISGWRPVDDIDEEIRLLKAEVIALRRKHLNTFYYL